MFQIWNLYIVRRHCGNASTLAAARNVIVTVNWQAAKTWTDGNPYEVKTILLENMIEIEVTAGHTHTDAMSDGIIVGPICFQITDRKTRQT